MKEEHERRLSELTYKLRGDLDRAEKEH